MAFQNGRRAPFGFSKNNNFNGRSAVGGAIRIIVPNLVKFGQTVAEISRFNVFKMAAVRHLEFLKLTF